MSSKPKPSIDRPLLDLIDLCESKGWLKLSQLQKTPRTPPTPRTQDYTADDLLTTAEAAKVLGVSFQTVAQWRSSRKGPEFIKNGHWVRYKYAVLVDFAANRSRCSTSDKRGDK